ncbi:MAG: GNAT family N-acetyltransferase [Anaerolineales bacterium]|nr:GNAT family N-acetyltransferase [Anaerolineales bacterium]
MIDGISYRTIHKSKISRLAEIDRTEVIRIGYEVRDGELVEKDVMWDTPNFLLGGEGEHTVAAQIAFCRSHMVRDAIAIGAFEGEALVAIGVLTPNIRPEMAQFSYLHVSASHRRRGIASAIARQLFEHARTHGFKRVYVSATPSESAVGFYKSFGFDLVEKPLPELYELEPDDIHMILELKEEKAVGSA